MVLDESGVIPYIDRRVAGGGEREPPLIVCYRSSKSTARNVRMALDLEGPDRTTEIAPDGGSGTDRELRCALKGIWNPFDRHGGGRTHPRCN